MPEELSQEMFIAEIPIYINKCLVDNGFSRRQIDFLMKSYKNVGVSKATNRSMLGYLRSLAFDYESQILRATPYDHDGEVGSARTEVEIKGPNDIKRQGLIKPTAKRAARALASEALRHAT